MRNAASQTAFDGIETEMSFGSNMRFKYHGMESNLLKSADEDFLRCLIVNPRMMICFCLIYRLTTTISFEEALPSCVI